MPRLMRWSSCTDLRYWPPLTERPSSTRAQLSGSRSPSWAVRPTRDSQSSTAQALLQAHWLTKCAVKASPSTASAASSTLWPSDSQSEAVAWTAATHSASTSLPVGEVVITATRRPDGAEAAAAAKDGPRSGGAQ